MGCTLLGCRPLGKRAWPNPSLHMVLGDISGRALLPELLVKALGAGGQGPRYAVPRADGQGLAGIKYH